MSIFNKLREPVFLKESSNIDKQIEELQLLQKIAPKEIAEEMDKEIRQLSAGKYGEDQIIFELKNSHMPLYVVQDLYLESGDLSAQIDFLIITKKFQVIIECKNLYGNIEINHKGNFLRTISQKGKTWKEGIYSPITQNVRHLELLKKLRLETKNATIKKFMFERYFYENYKSIVVLANTKTVLNDKYATKEVKNQVIRSDQLIEYIKKEMAASKNAESSDSNMESLAMDLLKMGTSNKTDYTEKYRKRIPEFLQNENTKQCEQQEEEVASYQVSKESIPTEEEDLKSTAEIVPVCPKCGMEMVKRVAKRGENVGNAFWGCINYPKCRSIININPPEVCEKEV